MEQYGEREYFLTLYVVLPLIVLSFSMGALGLFVNNNAVPNSIVPKDQTQILKLALQTQSTGNHGRDIIGVMTPEITGFLKYETDLIEKLFSDYNIAQPYSYGVYKATGWQATIDKLKSYLSVTERLHVAAHGSWDSSVKSKIALADGELVSYKVEAWKKINGLCKLIFLSSCNSLGHDGILDDTLAKAIRQRSNVKIVIGYKDEANWMAALLLAEEFWCQHAAVGHSKYGHSYTPSDFDAGPAGGYSAYKSFINAKNKINYNIDVVEGATDAGIALTSILLAGAGIFGFPAEVLIAIGTPVLLHIIFSQMRETVANFELVGLCDVDGLYPQPAGGGGGSVVTPTWSI